MTTIYSWVVFFCFVDGNPRYVFILYTKNMKKSFLFKWVSILGAVLLFANVSLSGLVAYAKEAESTGSEATLVYDVIYNAETYTALYAGNETLLASLDAYNGEEWWENFPWVVIQTPAEWFEGTIKFDYLGGEWHEYTGDTSKAPFGKHPIITGGEYLVKSIPVAFDDETLKDDGFDSDKLTISYIPETVTELENGTDWYFIDDDGSNWDEVYGDGTKPLYKYYEDYPIENLWNITEDRVCNSNDIRYDAVIYESQDDQEWIEVTLTPTWWENYEKVSDGTNTYYIEKPLNVGDGNKYPLYSWIDHCSLLDEQLPEGASIPQAWLDQWLCQYMHEADVVEGVCTLPTDAPEGAEVNPNSSAVWCVYNVYGEIIPEPSGKYVELISAPYDACGHSWKAITNLPWIVGKGLQVEEGTNFEWLYEDGDNPAERISIVEPAVTANANPENYRMVSVPVRFPDVEDFDVSKFSVKLTTTAEESVEIVKATHEVTVSFESDWWGDVESQTVELWQKVTEPDPAPTKDGYTLSGWQKCTDESTCTDFDFNTAVTEDTILKAKWAKTETKTSWGSSGWWGGGWLSKTTQSDTKATTWDNAKLDDTKADETKSEENNDENKDGEKTAPMTEAQAVEKFGQEQIDAYKWALENGITTMKTVEAARLDEPLTRAELSKMMVVYIQKVLQKDPILTGDVNYSDVGEELGDLFGYIKLAYQYQIMGINADGTPIELFNPYGIVSRWEYATVFSRVLFGAKFNKEGVDFYTNHLEALKTAGILTNTLPTIQEMRGWVMLMMYRSSQNGEAIEKVATAAEENKDGVKADETAKEETVTNEEKAETNEEAKAEETTSAESTTGDTAEVPATEEVTETNAENTETAAESTTWTEAEATTWDTASS